MAATQKTKKILFWLGLSLPMLALAFMVWLVHREDGRSSSSLNWVIQNSKIMNLFEQAQEHIVDAESSQRGYLLTGRADYLQPYQDAMTAVDTDLEGLKKLTKDNPEQALNVIELTQMVKEKLVFDPATAFASGRTPADASVIELTERGRKEIEDMRHILYVAHEEQERALGRHQQAVADEAISSQLTSITLILAVAIALIFVVVILFRLEKLQQFVTVCAWTGRVKSHGQWLRLDEYLKKEFDISVSHSLSQEAAEKMRVEIEELNRAENRAAAAK
jgi:CHASE3 domain sensor protein